MTYAIPHHDRLALAPPPPVPTVPPAGYVTREAALAFIRQETNRPTFTNRALTYAALFDHLTTLPDRGTEHAFFEQHSLRRFADNLVAVAERHHTRQ